MIYGPNSVDISLVSNETVNWLSSLGVVCTTMLLVRFYIAERIPEICAFDNIVKWLKIGITLKPDGTSSLCTPPLRSDFVSLIAILQASGYKSYRDTAG